MPDTECAAGLRCAMITNGCVPIASSRHRCPGRLQNFMSCNKPIHAICGIEIENPTNGDMFNKWCYNCATAPMDLPSARSIHKFQGETYGPDHPMKYMGPSTFEGNNPGVQSQLVASLQRTTETKENVVGRPENQRGRGCVHVHPPQTTPEIPYIQQAAKNHVQSSTKESQSTDQSHLRILPPTNSAVSRRTTTPTILNNTNESQSTVLPPVQESGIPQTPAYMSQFQVNATQRNNQSHLNILPPANSALARKTNTTTVMNDASARQSSALPPVQRANMPQNPYVTNTTPRTALRQRTSKFGSPRKMQRVKQFHFFLTQPVPQAQMDPSQCTFKFAIFFRAHNNMTKDNSVIEFKAEVFVMMCDLLYSTRNTASELRIGSMNDYTDMITSSFTETHRIRARPGEEDDSYKTSGNGLYYAEQVGGLFEITVKSADLLQQELNNIVDEFKYMVSCEGFFHVYKYAAFWKYCNEPGTPIETLIENVNREVATIGNRDQVFNRARSTGRLYQILIQDQHETLRKVLGTTEMLVKYNVSLDEVLQNEDIAQYTKGLIGLYAPAYRRVLFLKDIPNRDLSFLDTNYD